MGCAHGRNRGWPASWARKRKESPPPPGIGPSSASGRATGSTRGEERGKGASAKPFAVSSCHDPKPDVAPCACQELLGPEDRDRSRSSPPGSARFDCKPPSARRKGGRECIRALGLSLRRAFFLSLAEDAPGRSRLVADAFPKPVASGGSGGETPELDEPDGPSSSLRGDRGLPSRARTWGGNEHAPAGPQLRGVADVPVDRVAGGRDRPCRVSLPRSPCLRVRGPPRQCPRTQSQRGTLLHVHPLAAGPHRRAPRQGRPPNAVG